MSFIKNLSSFNDIAIKPWFVLLLMFTVVNALVLDVLLLNGTLTKKQIILSQQKQNIQHTPDVCPSSCITQINQAINAEKASPSSLQTVPNTTSSVKEFYVPFGTGTDSQAYWDPVDSMQAYVNPTSYTKIKQVVFEVSLSLPQANESVSVQLYNMSANHPVWNSIVTMQSGQKSAFLVSSPISLDNGNNLYQVQMQTQLNTPATITQARLHIYTY